MVRRLLGVVAVFWFGACTRQATVVSFGGPCVAPRPNPNSPVAVLPPPPRMPAVYGAVLDSLTGRAIPDAALRVVQRIDLARSDTILARDDRAGGFVVALEANRDVELQVRSIGYIARTVHAAPGSPPILVALNLSRTPLCP